MQCKRQTEATCPPDAEIPQMRPMQFDSLQIQTSPKEGIGLLESGSRPSLSPSLSARTRRTLQQRKHERFSFVLYVEGIMLTLTSVQVEATTTIPFCTV